ncbi:hypothetical protein Ari01nite_46420 [Paractinoplanes rishiriensis]|uniref:ABC3 transporter permease C-terminal domain-containing protein n=1 Tax=Paractinoplanes rishiriensis TaxID=1050105 RepID=A0A919N1K7_9ACTN|nr:hypothetical protein Ari01nite_46420 [Actinoplanes rishiriensis]
MSWGAVRRRTGAALAVLVLATIAATAAAAAPWYGLTVATRAAGAEVTARPDAEQVITVHRPGRPTGGDPRRALDEFAGTVRGLLPLPGATPVLGLVQDTTYLDRQRGNSVSDLPLAYRDGFCANVRLTGTCPDRPDTVAISGDAARRLGLAPGGTLPVRPGGAVDEIPLRITGVYEPTGGTYWSDPLFRSRGDLDPAFTSLDTFRRPRLDTPILGYALPVPLPLLRGDNLYDLNGVLNAAGPRFAAAQLDLDNPTGKLFDAVLADRVTVLRNVLIALGQLLVLAWFALALAARLTGRDRRADAGLLRLRGTPRGGLLRLALGQHVVPLAGAAVLGLPLGIAASGLVAGGLPIRAEWWPALAFSAGAVAAALGVGLLVLTAVDLYAQRAPVIALLRRVPAVRSDWRSRFVDLTFLALAAGAVYQARTGGPDSGLGIAAPALVALAVGLLLARLLRRLTDRAGAGAVRAGRLRFGLAAVQVSRQPGTDRVFALLVVSVALLALTAGGVQAGQRERADRGDVELGAARVLTVRAESRTALQRAVRAADPAGTSAMAAVLDTTTRPAVLAVDSARLAAVATWRPEYGPVDALPAAVAAARLPAAAPLVTGRTLAVRVVRGPAGPGLLGAALQHEGTGAGIRVEFRGLRPGAQEVTAATPACAVPPGCRLVGWKLFPGGRLTVAAVSQRDPAATIMDGAALADVSRWHAGFVDRAPFVAAGDGLALAAGKDTGTDVTLVDAPLPVPVVLAGARPEGWRFDDALSGRFGGTVTPVRAVATVGVLPVLGRDGMLTDLDTARRVAGDADLGGTFQVWLAPDAPPGLPAALEANGLTVLSDRTAAARVAELAAAGDVITAPFVLFAAAMAVLLAAAMVAVAATAEREPQIAMLRSLRLQGVSRGLAATAGYAGVAALVPAGVAGGVLAALLARPLAGLAAPPFPDGWRVLAPPGLLDPPLLAGAAAAALFAFGLAGWLGTRGLRAGLR